ncbi:MAG: hypothetical protein RMJ07_01635 [Nitrososphaerota archaeon]|nr:hypothetical protein [Candidatus Bathyarchaeota archaeon]MDW8048371.1 hypothetical protein [Nitrososphaerota archaeon]
MGFSVTIASTIILIGLVAFAGAVASSLMFTLENIAAFTDISNRTGSNVDIKLNITSLEARRISFYVKNRGSKPIFFMGQQDYKWNTVIISYDSDGLRSYVIEDYVISEVRVEGTNVTFNVHGHQYINPGEEALIEVYLPQLAPDIPQNAVVLVIFISHYGSTAMKEGVRN